MKYGDWHLGDRPVSVGTGQTTKLRGIFRRGTSLIELIVVMGMIGMLLTLAATLDRSAWSEPPREATFSQQNLQIDDMLRRMRADVEAASKMRMEGDRAVVLVQGKEGSVTYRQTGVAVERRSERPDGKQIQRWDLPAAHIEWNAWTKDGKAQALEVRSFFLMGQAGHERKKLANARVFFLGAAVEDAE